MHTKARSSTRSSSCGSDNRMHARALLHNVWSAQRVARSALSSPAATRLAARVHHQPLRLPYPKYSPSSSALLFCVLFCCTHRDSQSDKHGSVSWLLTQLACTHSSLPVLTRASVDLISASGCSGSVQHFGRKPPVVTCSKLTFALSRFAEQRLLQRRTLVTFERWHRIYAQRQLQAVLAMLDVAASACS
jgi:hypothetical protein